MREKNSFLRCSMCNEEKTALRREWKARRNGISKKEEKSRKIAENLLSLPAMEQAKMVFLYLSVGSEAETITLAKELLFKGKRIAVPVCDRKTHTMAAAEITDVAQVTVGAYGLSEPKEKKIISKEEIDLILVPGLAFDKAGYRLGYGGGYYDRYLDGFAGISIGLCFEECLTDRLPQGKYDKPVDLVITEVGVM